MTGSAKLQSFYVETKFLKVNSICIRINELHNLYIALVITNLIHKLSFVIQQIIENKMTNRNDK